jgi:glycosyltransferase involved in cell wall biosynthesis
MRIAMIGTRGVPAHYGGFETAVEEIGRRLVDRGHEVTVFCRSSGDETNDGHYLGMSRVVLPALSSRTLETLSHTALSVVHRSLANVDAAMVFNAANAPLLPVLRARGIPVATHVDGLEWQRAKWGPLGRRYYRVAESLAVRWSDQLIADAVGIADYYHEEFDAPTRYIAYGAPILEGVGSELLEELDLASGEYHLVVARFEPENHVLELVRGYVASDATKPLVVVGSAPYADAYIAAVREAADDRVRLLGGVWRQDLLDQLYANAYTYLHGHSVGGTNPSLLRAAGAGAPIIAWDVIFNREVLGEPAWFVGDEAAIRAALEAAEADPEDTAERGRRLQTSIRRYDWDDVARTYEALCEELVAGRGDAPRPSGRRRRSGRGAGIERTNAPVPDAEHDHGVTGSRQAE